MRPLKLELAGFGSFREATTFDFDGIDYFALVGPTGNGKSTVIDAICFALYGKVARHDDRSVVSNIVSLNANEARVRLTFTAGGANYVAVRAIKLRKGSPKHDARLETSDGDILAASVREFTTAIEQLLGLSFDDFTRCVALPQGEFQRFLHEEPAKRRAVLVRLLNLGHYERMGQRAREHASRLHERRALLTEQRDELAPVSPEVAKLAREHMTALKEAQERFEASRVADAARSESLRVMAATAAGVEHSVNLLTRVQLPPTLVVTLPDGRDPVTELTAAQAASQLAATEVMRREAAVTDIGDIGVVERGLALWAQRAELSAGLATKEAAMRAIDADVAAAQVALDAARRAASDANEELERVRNDNRAHVLRTELHNGDTCPVCAHVVAEVPTAVPPAEYGLAHAAAQHAKERAEATERAHKRIVTEQQQASGALTSLREQFARVDAQLRNVPSAEALTDQRNAYTECQAALTAAREQQRSAAQAEQRAVRARDEHTQQSQALQHTFDEQRDAVAQLQPPPRSHNDLAGDWQALHAWANEQQAALATQLRELSEQLERLRVAHDAQRVALVQHAATLGVSARGYDDLPTAIATNVAQAEHAVHEHERRAQEVTELLSSINAISEEHSVAKMVGDLLRTDGFVSWLIEAALVSLIRDASSTLHLLSAGQYSLRQGSASDFEIVDHTNGDQARPVRSLSGGETFQASLALALALSDQISELAAEGAPRLEAIFLDEGFGTLDPESLDTVATTLETLGTSGRMVGVVTHVRDLAERIPVRFEITKINNCSHVEMVLA